MYVYANNTKKKEKPFTQITLMYHLNLIVQRIGGDKLCNQLNFTTFDELHHSIRLINIWLQRTRSKEREREKHSSFFASLFHFFLLPKIEKNGKKEKDLPHLWRDELFRFD